MHSTKGNRGYAYGRGESCTSSRREKGSYSIPVSLFFESVAPLVCYLVCLALFKQELQEAIDAAAVAGVGVNGANSGDYPTGTLGRHFHFR